MEGFCRGPIGERLQSRSKESGKPAELQHLPPQELAETIIKGEQRIALIMREITSLLESKA